MARSTASAVGERQMLPRHTKSILTRILIAARRSMPISSAPPVSLARARTVKQYSRDLPGAEPHDRRASEARCSAPTGKAASSGLSHRAPPAESALRSGVAAEPPDVPSAHQLVDPIGRLNPLALTCPECRAMTRERCGRARCRRGWGNFRLRRREFDGADGGAMDADVRIMPGRGTPSESADCARSRCRISLTGKPLAMASGRNPPRTCTRLE